MILYPEIALKDGRLVTLRRGQMTSPIRYDRDPVEQARAFAAEGAEWLHVVDLDAVLRGRRHNGDIVRSIIRAVDIPVQVGGGIAKMEQVDDWIGEGAECVVIASAAVLNPALVRRACERYPFRVLVSVDVSQGRVMVDGWTRPSELSPLDFVAQFDRLDLAGVIVTDIDYDIDLPDASFALVTDLARRLATPVVASGVVKTLDDLATLRFLENVAGAVIGRALHQGRFTLHEALRVVWDAEPKDLWWRQKAPEWSSNLPATRPRMPRPAASPDAEDGAPAIGARLPQTP